jgi:hypothetical protein
MVPVHAAASTLRNIVDVVINNMNHPNNDMVRTITRVDTI